MSYEYTLNGEKDFDLSDWEELLGLLSYFKFNEKQTTCICEVISMIILMNQFTFVEGGIGSRYKV